MPIYEYACDDHGDFELARSVAECSRSAPCPVCGGAARRVLSAPNLGTLARSTVRALDRNEKNRHEPRVAQHAPRAAPDPERPRPSVAAGGRPWMIGH